MKTKLVKKRNETVFFLNSCALYYAVLISNHCGVSLCSSHILCYNLLNIVNVLSTVQ